MTATKIGTGAPGLKATWLINLYMKINQLIYAIVAFPIGTVLSITPILLIHLGADLAEIGYMMAAGEFFGIFAMLYAEKSEKGFVFRRPYDLLFINGMLALSLILIPFTGKKWWYVSAIFMMLVQFFNSASKPVMGESLHRLAVLTEKDPSIVFARANSYRRVGNSLMGFCTPLLYAYVKKLPFALIGGLILLFSIACLAMETKIKSIYLDELNSHPEVERRLSRRMSFDPTSLTNTSTERESMQPINESLQSSETKSATASRRRNRNRNKRTSTITMLSNLIKREDGRSEIDGRSKIGNDSITETPKPMPTSVYMHYDLEDNSTPTPTERKHYFRNVSALSTDREYERTQAIIENDDEADNEEDEKLGEISALSNGEIYAINKSVEMTQTIVDEGDEENNEEDGKPVHDSSRIEKGREENDETIAHMVEIEEESNLSYYLIVWIFPFWDAVISRLPFSFLMICIVEPKYDELNGFGDVNEDVRKRNMIILAGVVLFLYQFMRSIAQAIQVRRCDTRINYVLNVIALLGYFAFAMITQFSNTRLWFIPIVFTGFAETLPIQQLYLVGLFGHGGGNEREMSIRHAVQTSHTSTGAGSCIAFLVGSQIYNKFRLRGIAYLGLTVMVLKLATNIVIDVLHNKKEKKAKTMYRKDSATYMKVFEAQRIAAPS